MIDDFLPDTEFLRYFLNDKNNNLLKNNNINNNKFKNVNENKRKNQEVYNEEILENLKFSILKNNLLNKNKVEEKNESIFEKKIEKSMNKEILFLLMARLYKNDQKTTRSFIIRKINEIIMEDDLYENLILLSYFQKFKNRYFEKKIYKNNQNHVKMLLELFSKTDLGDFDLNKSK